MNICYLVRSFSARAGTESYVCHTAIALAKQGHRVHVVSLTGQERALFKDFNNKIVFHKIKLKDSVAFRLLRLECFFPLSVFLYGKAIARVLSALIEDQAIDIVEATDWGMDAWAYLPERRVPVCVRLHGYPGCKAEFDSKTLKAWPKNYINWVMQRNHILDADLVTAVSQGYIDFVRVAWEIKKKYIRIIPIAIDRSIFHPFERIRKNNAILFVGRLESAKGMATLGRAICLILKIIPEAVFYFAGVDHQCDDKQQTWSRYLISKFGNKHIVYLGSIQTQDLIRCYQEATICVVPSLYEPGGTVIFEAMACGCPVLASRVGGLEEVIQDRHSGLLVPPGDAAALAAGMLELLQDPQLRQQYAQNALESVRNKFDINAIATQTVQAYAEAITTFNAHRRSHP
jgi:glycosyltransferase involved in cell wall biosynthesis